MATVTMSYNSEPPPLPERPRTAGQPQSRRNASVRRPLPNIPTETPPSVPPPVPGRPLPDLPPHPTSKQRSQSVPHNHFSPPHSEGLHRQFHSVSSQHNQSPTSPKPPQLPPPRRGSVDHAHLQRTNTVTHSPTSPPVPPRVNSLDNHNNGHVNHHNISSPDFEVRFHFHKLEDLPPPDPFTDRPKVYLSRANAKENRRKRAEADLPAV